MRDRFKRLVSQVLKCETPQEASAPKGKTCLWWLILGCLSTLSISTPVGAEPHQALAQTVVQIKGADPLGRFYFGSGVLIDHEWVATNCHVVRQGGRVLVVRSGQGFKATRLKADTFKDLCLLKVPGIGIKGAQLRAGAPPKVGSAVSYYGFPRALGMSYAEGQVTHLHPLLGGSLIQTSAFFTLGGSGGGLFDVKGRLVGLATFLTSGHSGAYFVIPAAWIEDVQEKPEDLITPLLGKAFWEDSKGFAAILKGPKSIKARPPG